MQFRDKTAYVWGLRYRWDPTLSRKPLSCFPHFMPPWWRDSYDDDDIKTYTNNCYHYDRIMSKLIQPQIGPGESYSLSVGGFNATLSTLGDSMYSNNGQKFSTRWESKDNRNNLTCLLTSDQGPRPGWSEQRELCKTTNRRMVVQLLRLDPPHRATHWQKDNNYWWQTNLLY